MELPKNTNQKCQTPEQRRLGGWIAPAVRTLIRWITWPPEMIYGPRDTEQAKFAMIDEQAKPENVERTIRRSMKVDNWVAGWVVFELIAFVFVTDLRKYPTCCPWIWLAAVLVGYRSLHIPALALRIAVFDRLGVRPGNQPVVASLERMVVLAIVNYVELILCFSVIYATSPNLIASYKDWFDPIHLSAATQLTFGYGDVHPTSWLRPVTIIQALFALLLLVLSLGRFVTGLPPERSTLGDVEPAPTAPSAPTASREQGQEKAG
jgi:hypothetical protein